MNWLDHENSPRKRPPLSHGVQSIARVQPLVPEVSMWMSSSHGNLDQSLEEQDQEEEEKEETISQKPAQLENIPREESQNSAKVKAPTIIQSPNTASTTQGDLYQLLQSQSEQIASLHEALRKLILDRSTNAPSTNKAITREIGVQTQPLSSPKVVADQATQCQRDDESVKPRYQSPVRVESTSVSSSESKESEEVLDQLQRACMRGSTEKALLHRGQANDSVGDTMSRLRNLGISFVDRNHLKDVPISDTRFDSNYPLGLKALGDTNFSTVQSIASDSSMAINSAALKYLDDRQLTALANNRGGRPKNGPVEHEPRDSGVTKYGLPLQQLSFHTKNFLENTVEPASRNREGKNDILENLTQLLQQPKLRP